MVSTISSDDMNTLLTKLNAGINEVSEKKVALNKAEKLIASYSHQLSEQEKSIFRKLLNTLATLLNCHSFAGHINPSVFKHFGEELIKSADEEMINAYLDIFRSPEFLTKIYEDDDWADIVLNLLHISNYTFQKMFFHRAERYKKKILFTILESDKRIDYSWTRISKLVTAYTRGLLAQFSDFAGNEKVAFFTKNSLDMVLYDLACLTGGIVNVMIPANSVPAHIEYILKKTEPSVLVVSDESFFEKIKTIINKLTFIKAVIIFDQVTYKEEIIYSNEKIIEIGKKVERSTLVERRNKVKLNDLATIMFTSGTTGNPKGIQFTHQNIVFKRFARAMALPEIGENDSFLAYLPLFHTFGRWFEMTGSIFWGAHYFFMENTTPEVMVENMQRVRPSIFISIPKKWYQLYERVEKDVNIIKGSDEEILRAVKTITGGNLKWGLSAAGYLDVEVFQFFQNNGIELMSGFGMTEATGGITMTPPGRYKPNSLGKALPGIQLKVGDDGELLIKGPYVTPGYVNPEETDVKFTDGWLPTGDIMEVDEDNFIQIIDRKKEIYKNIKGETIAPQKIENYFRDFDFIKHVFLVGDHRPYNTLLIYPNYDFEDIDFRGMNEEELRSYFSSVIVSVNRFLAAFERIVDFTIIDRDFDPDKDELTPKGTYRRKTVENNFGQSIKPMYERNYISIIDQGNEIRVPNWFLREKGLTPEEIMLQKNRLNLKNVSSSLRIKFEKGLVQVGNYRYEVPGKILELGKLLTDPVLWVGNDELVEFTNNKIFKWSRIEKSKIKIIYHSLAEPSKISRTFSEKRKEFKDKYSISLGGLHEIALLIQKGDENQSSAVLEYLEKSTIDRDTEHVRIAKEILARTLHISPLHIQRKAFVVLLGTSLGPRFLSITKSFLDKSPAFIDTDMITRICKVSLDNKKLEMFFQIARDYCRAKDKRTVNLFRLFSRYGASHPTRYKIIRQFLASCQLEKLGSGFGRAARVARFECRDGFREWLGTTQEVAVDIETGEEYHWEDVIIFEESIDSDDKERLLAAIKNTTLIREAIFLFSNGVLVRLNDIPRGGVWVSLLGKEHGKAVYRITIQTRYQGSFDIAVNVNHEIEFEDILDEINWLIQAGTAVGDIKLVEDFGGYWDQYDLWSEEFIQGETAGKFIARMMRQQDETIKERVRQIWPYFIWSGVSAYVKFWDRTRRRLELDIPSPANIIIPVHDYQTGSRIVSISGRRDHLSSLDMKKNFLLCYVEQIEDRYPTLKGIGQYKYIFSAIIEALGQKEGMAFLNECLALITASKKSGKEKQLASELKNYISSVNESGFIPKRLYFAIKRYHRWRKLNQKATLSARAATLAELYETYQLNLLENEYPETRTRFFTNTVFTHSSDELRSNLEEIISEQQNGQLQDERFTQQISTLQKSIEVRDDDVFFLARLSYPHLQPTDSADLISLERGGVLHTDLLIKSKDYEGDTFFIRAPVNPKEIARLHQLFIKNNLGVQFKPEHLYLIAVNERNQLIGGVFYRKIAEDTVHIEKIVVADFYRRKGVSDRILKEFFQRMKNEHYVFITTGFFRPEYFYRFGFTIERKYAGLVKNLGGEELEESVI